MSSFDDITDDIPQLRSPAKAAKDGYCCASVRMEALVLHAKHHPPTAFSQLLREACLDGACHHAVLQLNDAEAQTLVDAIQSVSTPILLLHNGRYAQHILDTRSTGAQRHYMFPCSPPLGRDLHQDTCPPDILVRSGCRH
jgi:hypothetical protein